MKKYISIRIRATAYAILLASLLNFASSAHAQVAIENAWIRPTVSQQKVTGAFLTITSPENTELIGASSPVADYVEIHEMKMDKDVMTMRAVPKIDLPAGQAVSLAPGGLHLMLFDLKKAIKVGDKVPLTLTLRDKQKKESQITVFALAKSRTGH